jgi:phosphomannomutase / phosphoglucomutase
MLKELNTFHIDPSIFRAYDIRGIVGKTLTKESVYVIGCALAFKAKLKGDKKIVVARDGRLSGPVLVSALCEGIMAAGCDVINLGVVPTPLLYYSTHLLETSSGIMLTGSHNPPDYNGLKMMIAGETLTEAAIQDLYQFIVARAFKPSAKKGKMEKFDITDAYLAHVARDAKLARPLRIVIDCGNGVAGNIAPDLYRSMGCTVHELHCHVDGNFPNHHPDPSQPENLADLIRAVRETHADIGLAFDGDGDRLGVVTNSGEIIWPDRQLMLFAQALLKEQPGAKIIYDVKCSYHLEKVIRDAGGEPLMWKTGHSFIKAKLAETQGALAGEMSGHIFFKDRWYGFDDAIYAGARMLQILAAQSASMDELFNTIPDSVNTPEIKIYVDESEKFALIDQFIAWGLVRTSNTTPCLVLRFEAQTEAVLEKIKAAFRENLLAIKPEWVLPF